MLKETSYSVRGVTLTTDLFEGNLTQHNLVCFISFYSIFLIKSLSTFFFSPELHLPQIGGLSTTQGEKMARGKQEKKIAFFLIFRTVQYADTLECYCVSRWPSVSDANEPLGATT